MANGTIGVSQIDVLTTSGTGTVSIVPPATNTNRTLTLPDETGTVITTATTTGINASALSTGTISTARLPIVPIANGGTGSSTATFSGANITNLNASALSTGTIPTSVIPVVPIANGGTGSSTATFSGANITSLNAGNISSGVLAVANGGTGSSTATFSGANITALNASNISTGTLAVARGGTGATTLTANNVILGNGTSAVQVVAPGTSGNVLRSNGTTWTSASAGTIAASIEAVQVSKNNTFSSTSTTYVDVTGLSVAITPSSATNKILVIVCIGSLVADDSCYARLLRGATEIGSGSGTAGVLTQVYSGGASTGEHYFGTVPTVLCYLDSPATTSSTTYKIQVRANSGTVYVNRNVNNTAPYDGLTISTITLMEVAP
jgi:hypothetical protein